MFKLAHRSLRKSKRYFSKTYLTTMYIKRRRVGVRQAHIWSEKVTELMTGVESATFWCKTSSILHTLCDGIRFLFNDFCGFSLSSSWSYSKSSLLWILSVLCGFIYTLARPSLNLTTFNDTWKEIRLHACICRRWYWRSFLSISA